MLRHGVDAIRKRMKQRGRVWRGQQVAKLVLGRCFTYRTRGKDYQ
ncbi:unnamed protein product [Brassica oleracea var. botrytis]